mgnify:FL=1
MEIIGLQKTVISRLSFLIPKIKNKRPVAYKKTRSNKFLIALTRKKESSKMVTIQKSADGKKYKFRFCPESRCMVKTGEKRIWKFFPELLR